MAVVLTLLIFRLPSAAQYACLNATFLAVFDALRQTPPGQMNFSAACLPESSPLLSGERGALRKLHISLARLGPQASEQIPAGFPVVSLPIRLAHLVLGNSYLQAGNDNAAIAALSQAGDLQQLILTGNAARRAGNDQRALAFWLRPARSGASMGSGQKMKGAGCKCRRRPGRFLDRAWRLAACGRDFCRESAGLAAPYARNTAPHRSTVLEGGRPGARQAVVPGCQPALPGCE